MGNTETIIPGMFYRNRERIEGVSISVMHGGAGMTQQFLEEMNAEYNSNEIYVDYYDISEIGGLGGPGANIIDVINSPDFPLKIYLGQLVFGLFTNFAYDLLKQAITNVIKNAKPNSGNSKVEIHHHSKIVVFNFNIDFTTEDDIDFQLKTLLSDSILKEQIEEDPETVRRILDKYSRG